jgi:cytochrome c-type biogenesis protein CcmH/NrfG
VDLRPDFPSRAAGLEPKIRRRTGECDFNHTLPAKVTGECEVMRERRFAVEDKGPGAGQWTSTQAHVLSVICLLVGVAVGYLVRGSAPSSQAAIAPARAGATEAAPASMAAASQPTSEPLRQIADTEAQPLVKQLENDPRNSTLLYQIGNLYYDAQEYPEAVKYYQESLEIDPKATDVRTDMATAYHLMGQPDRAIQEYDAVLKIDGKHANALFNEGMVKWQDKMDVNGAIRTWRRLLEAHPDFAQRDKVEKLIAQAEQHLTMKTGSEAAN